MNRPTNVQITRIQDARFKYEDKWVTPRSKEREQRRIQKKITAPKKAKRKPLTDKEAEDWAAELDKLCALTKNNPNMCYDRGGWRMLQEYKMSEEYNQWHTLDDHLDYSALLRGIHNIQEKYPLFYCQCLCLLFLFLFWFLLWFLLWLLVLFCWLVLVDVFF